MTKPKTLEQLRAEKERAETQLAQEQHILRICQVDKFLGDEDKNGLYAWNGFGKVAPAAEG